MFKLQLQLVPASAVAAPQQSSIGFNNSQMLANMSGISLNNLPPYKIFRRDQGTAFPMVNQSFNLSAVPRSNQNIKRLLHFTKKTNDLQQLCDEIIQKVTKMYPDLPADIEIETLQDQSGCDLDPDFIVGDVFASDNIVQVLLKTDIDWEDHVPVSGYARKRTKLSETRRIDINNQVTDRNDSLHHPSNDNGNATRRPSAQPGKGMMYKGVRVSTPLVHQIQRPNIANDENIVDPKDKSLLLPPTVPQSPPIRISSGMEIGKQIKNPITEDSVSRSETVDPSKSKQQRLQAEFPRVPMTTPKRTDMIKPTIAIEVNGDEHSYSENKISSVKRYPSLQTPKVSYDVATHLPQAQSHVLPGSTPLPHANNNHNKIPISSVRNLYSQQAASNQTSASKVMHIDNLISSNTADISNSPRTHQQPAKPISRTLKRQQSTIADNNGSPVKNGSIETNGIDNTDQVHLAALPAGRNIQKETPKDINSFVNVTPQASNLLNNERVVSNNLVLTGNKENVPSEPQSKLFNKTPQTSTLRGSLNEDPVPNRNRRRSSAKSSAKKSFENTSFQKKHLIDVLHSKNPDLPSWLKEGAIKPQRKHSKKPYITVVNNDIDNSQPDARNILPKHTPRDAAKKAAEKMAENQENEHSDGSDESDTSSSSSDSDSDSGIQTDYYSDDNMASKLNLSKPMATNLATKTVPSAQETVVSRTDISFSSNNVSQTNDNSSNPTPQSKSKAAIIPNNLTSKTTGVKLNNRVGTGVSNQRPARPSGLVGHELDNVPQSTQPETSAVETISKKQLVNNSQSQNSTVMLQTVPPKVRPSLHTMADIDNKKYEKFSKNETLEIPLVHDTSSSDLGDSTSSDLSSDGSYD